MILENDLHLPDTTKQNKASSSARSDCRCGDVRRIGMPKKETEAGPFTFVEGGLRAVSAGHQQAAIRIELHRGIVVSVGRRAPPLHESNTVFFGVRERPVTARAVVGDSDIDPKPLKNGILLAEG